MSQVPNEDDTFKILVATDNHLGYGENKPIIGEDSFKTFEEILQIAVAKDVDFILLGGDLFHDSHPSTHCLLQCTELLRRYCLGSKPVSIEYLSDQSDNFKFLRNPIVNYEDPNLNISIPVFSIHGNHDNPIGIHQISALNLLASTGLVNYFGRWTDPTKLDIKPILLRKGQSQIALYGLSHIPDQRLARMFRDRSVSMPKPEGDWFNMTVIHQNRADRGAKNFIPSSVIPEFMHLIIWGHEHDCLIDAEDIGNGVYISQPGSSVATSLSAGEAQRKHVGLLQIYKTQFIMDKIVLKTVRPFIFGELLLKHPDSDDFQQEKPQEQAIEDVKRKINEMISIAAERHDDPDTTRPLPLIRLIVRYCIESQIFNAIRMGHEFENRVANPADIIKIVSSTIRRRPCRPGRDDFADDDMADAGLSATRVEDVVEKYFENNARSAEMKILSAKLLTKAVAKYIDTHDDDAVSYAYDLQEKNILAKLIEKDPDFDNIDVCCNDIKEEILRDEQSEIEKLMRALNDGNRKNQTVSFAISDDSDDNASVSKPARGRGSRGGKGSRGGSTTRGRGRGSKSAKN